MSTRLFTTLGLLVTGLMHAPGGMLAQAPPASQRAAVVISDLHMGPGRDVSRGWDPYEDFRWSEEFAGFLAAVNREGQGATDLVLNGDTFELLQSNQPDCGMAADAGCTEAQALVRLERVLKAHEAELAALKRFARSGTNRIVFVPGDHDAALLFPAVGRRVVEVLSAPSGRVEIAAAGYWSADGKVYAEHGHQIGFNPHRFENWAHPFVRKADGEHLARPWGERAIQDAHNRLERIYPVVDNVAVSGAGVKYALAAEGAADIGDAAPWLLRYLLVTMSWQHFRVELDDGEVESPTWDIAQMRKQGPAFLLSSLPEDDPYRALAAKSLSDGRLGPLMEAMSDGEITAICDYRAAVRRARRRFEQTLTQLSPRGVVVSECVRTPESRGPLFEYFWGSRDTAFNNHLTGLARPAPADGRAARAVKEPAVFVHGHTHVPDPSQARRIEVTSGGLLKVPPEGFSPVRGAMTPVAINGGAWQRTITPVQLERLKAARGVSDDQLLRTLQPEDLASCYSFVHIPPYTGAPSPIVRYWRPAVGKDWAIGESCISGS